MVIVTLSERSSNYSDEFLGIWEDLDRAVEWVNSEYPSWQDEECRVHSENDMSWIGSHETAQQITYVFKDKMISFIIPN